MPSPIGRVEHDFFYATPGLVNAHVAAAEHTAQACILRLEQDQDHQRDSRHDLCQVEKASSLLSTASINFISHTGGTRSFPADYSMPGNRRQNGRLAVSSPTT